MNHGRGAEGQHERHDPERTDELHRGSHLEGAGTVGEPGSHDRGGVVDRQRSPGAEGVLAQAGQPADRREGDQRDPVQDEDRPERHRHLVLLGTEHGARGGDGASPADRRSHRDQRAGVPGDAEPPGEQQAQPEREGDGGDGLAESLEPGPQHHPQVHRRSQPHHRRRQQRLLDPAGGGRPRVAGHDGDGRPEQERRRRPGPGKEGDECACGYEPAAVHRRRHTPTRAPASISTRPSARRGSMQR
jgi:hypothetical protein